MNRSLLNKNWKCFPHQGDGTAASNTLCLSRAANSFAQRHPITQVFVGFVNEFKLTINITFSKDHSGSYILEEISLEAE